jgi:uroporphyrinogen-III synthase
MNAVIIRFAFIPQELRKFRSMTAIPSESKRILEGRTIVIIGQAQPLLERLGELELFGAHLISLPPFEVAELENPERLDEALSHLYGYDWILFTNPDSVHYFLRRLELKGLDATVLDDLRVCAVGNATEQLLRDEQVHADVVPASPEAAAVYASLEQFLGGASALTGLNFLSPRATSSPDSLARALTDAGARVDMVPTYRVQAATADSGRTAALVSGAADCLVLTGPESLSQLTRLFDAYDLSETLPDVLVLFFEEAVGRSAAACGLTVRPLRAQAATEQLAQEIANHLIPESQR